MKSFGYTVYGQYTTVKMFVNLSNSEANKLYGTYKEWLTIHNCPMSHAKNGKFKHSVEGILPQQSLRQWITDLEIAKAKTAVEIAQDKVKMLEHTHNGTVFHYLDDEEPTYGSGVFTQLMEDEDDLPF